MATDPMLPQMVQSAYQQISMLLRDEAVKHQVVTLLIKDGTLNDENWKTCNKDAIQLFILEEEAQAEASKAEEALRKVYEEPDSKIPTLWRSKNAQPERITQYLKTCNLKALENFLADLKDRPMHYNSLFPKGEMINVISFIEKAVENRLHINSQKAKPTPTKTETTNPNEKTKPYTA